MPRPGCPANQWRTMVQFLGSKDLEPKRNNKNGSNRLAKDRSNSGTLERVFNVVLMQKLSNIYTPLRNNPAFLNGSLLEPTLYVFKFKIIIKRPMQTAPFHPTTSHDMFICRYFVEKAWVVFGNMVQQIRITDCTIQRVKQFFGDQLGLSHGVHIYALFTVFILGMDSWSVRSLGHFFCDPLWPLFFKKLGFIDNDY